MESDYDVILYQERSMINAERAEYNLFSMLKPSIQRDGNQWCVLYGEDLQVGIAGFGDTPYEAILDWNKQWFEPIPAPKEDWNGPENKTINRA